MKLDLIDKKPQRDDYWFAAYSVTLRMPVLIHPDGGGLDKFYSIYRLSDEEFKKYDTEEFDAVVEDVRNNLKSRYLGRDSGLDLSTIELADGVVLSGIKSSYPAYDETPRRRYDDSDRVGEKVNRKGYFSVYYSKKYHQYVLDLVTGGSIMYSELYKISKEEYENSDTEEFQQFVYEVRSHLHKDRFLYSPYNPTKATFKISQRTQSSYPKKRDISLLVLVLLIIIGIVFLLLVGLGDIWGDKKTNSGIDDYTYPESGFFLEGIMPTSESTSSSN